MVCGRLIVLSNIINFFEADRILINVLDLIQYI